MAGSVGSRLERAERERPGELVQRKESRPSGVHAGCVSVRSGVPVTLRGGEPSAPMTNTSSPPSDRMSQSSWSDMYTSVRSSGENAGDQSGTRPATPPRTLPA
jgi:hypothetical protein